MNFPGPSKDRRWEGWSDFLSPLLLRNLRQSLRSKKAAGAYIILVLLGWAFSLLAYIGQDMPIRLARHCFAVLYILLQLMAFGLVPSVLILSLNNEKVLQLDEQLTLSSLSPEQRVWGNFLTGTIMGLMTFSALGPFIAFVYLLQGIDFWSLAMCLFLTLFISLLLCMYAIACLNSLRFVPGKSTSGYIFALFLPVTCIAAGMCSYLLRQQVHPRVLRLLIGPYFWVITLFLTSLYITGFHICYRVAVSALRPSLANRSTAVRVAFFLQFIVLLVWLVRSLYASLPPYFYYLETDTLVIWTLLHWAAAAFLFCPEWHWWSEPIREEWQSLSRRKKVFWRWFQPGGGRGFLFVSVGLLATLPFFHFTRQINCEAAFLLAAVILGYICLPPLVFQRFFPDMYSPLRGRLLVVATVVAAVVVHSLTAAYYREFFHPLFILNPLWEVSFLYGSPPRGWEFLVKKSGPPLYYSLGLIATTVGAYLVHLVFPPPEGWEPSLYLI